MLDLPRVSITRRDFQSAQRLQPAFYYALCTPWGSARRRGPSFPQNVWPAFDPMRESTSVLTALDPLFFNCEILSVLIQRLPAFTFNPQVPPIALTRPRVADRSELRATPDPPRVSITRRAIQAAQRVQTSVPVLSGLAVLVCGAAVPRFSELNRVLSQLLKTPARAVPECKPLVHLDAAPDSLDLSLDALPPPTPATRTLPTQPLPPSNSRSTPDRGCAARSLRPLLTSNHHHRPESVNPSGAAQRGDIQHQHPPRPIKARSRGPSPPTSLNLQPPPPPPSRIGQSVGSGAATPTTSSTTTTNNVAGVTTSAMLALVVVTVTALLVDALVVVALVDYLFFAPPFSALQWCEYYGAACGLRALYLFTPPSLRQINDLNPLARIAALAGFPSRFAREGPGFVYVLGLVDDWNLGDWHAHRIGDSQFLDHFRVKIGVAVDVHKRQQRYRKCDVFQSHFWLWSFRVRNRMVAERLCHTLLDIEDNNNRAAFQCPAPRCDTRHQEFWWLRRHGGFLTVHERVRAALALLGEREERIDLQHAWLASY
ncbi:hypothetical protein B0H16DRAFT_1732750 [Mycena metata]|uniref:Bacteriophage T5 Orf172 DNA-binding domain-containing protein n=1 Tax=Mycena metata TaxID=1033252 RepID=A0AAD7I0Z4_9AGAR|nr:hypothetical protein B0H16DRAFT_1732750 [Mycena metata]